MTPKRIKVNMFQCRVRMDFAPTTQNGHPHQVTTGAAKINCRNRPEEWLMIRSKDKPIIGAIAISSSGNEQATATVNRIHKSFSPESDSVCAADNRSGSSGIPQMGQLPG